MNFGPSAKDYAQHRHGFPASFFERVPLQGRVLDLGSGTGSVARGYAERGANVVALDISREMLAQIPSQIARVVSRAEVTPFADSSFDAITAGQCWHWFDWQKAAREVHRLLRAGGQVVIANFDYLPVAGNIAEVAERLILERNPGWPMAGVRFPDWRWQLEEVGLTGLELFSYDETVEYSHEAWRGRMRACNGVIALREPEKIADFDRALGDALTKWPDPIAIPHRVMVSRGRKA